MLSYTGSCAHNPKILNRGLSLERGKVLECEWISRYTADGWKLLNRRSGGGAGNIGKIFSKNKVLSVASRFNSLKSLRESHPEVVQALYSHDCISECTWLEKYTLLKLKGAFGMFWIMLFVKPLNMKRCGSFGQNLGEPIRVLFGTGGCGFLAF